MGIFSDQKVSKILKMNILTENDSKMDCLLKMDILVEMAPKVIFRRK